MLSLLLSLNLQQLCKSQLLFLDPQLLFLDQSQKRIKAKIYSSWIWQAWFEDSMTVYLLPKININTFDVSLSVDHSVSNLDFRSFRISKILLKASGKFGLAHLEKHITIFEWFLG